MNLNNMDIKNIKDFLTPRNPSGMLPPPQAAGAYA
jgi:hypothetical protein